MVNINTNDYILIDNLEKMFLEYDLYNEAIYLKIEYNSKINKAWENERIAKNSQKSLWEMVGKKVTVNAHGKFFYRVLKWNGYQFYTLIDNQKAVVKYSTIWDNWEVEYWASK